jgi:hypothetical protein
VLAESCSARLHTTGAIVRSPSDINEVSLYILAQKQRCFLDLGGELLTEDLPSKMAASSLVRLLPWAGTGGRVARRCMSIARSNAGFSCLTATDNTKLLRALLAQ